MTSCPSKPVISGGVRVFRLIVMGLAAFFSLNQGTAKAQANGTSTRSVFVAAASSLRFALDELSSEYFDKTGVVVKISYGSSGNLVRQILHGAPFEIFLSADDNYTRRLIENDATQGPPMPYARGRIGFFVSNSSPLSTIADLDELIEKIRRTRDLSFAIANPEHAPYGRAAKECLQSLGLWDNLAAQFIIGENATQATQFAASGQIAGGIVPLSLVKAPQIDTRGTFYLLPSACHSPLRLSIVMTRKGQDEARAFFVFLSSQTARDILKSFGFDTPDQE